jgi:hypothetical protein
VKTLLLCVILGCLALMNPGLMLVSALVLYMANGIGRRLRRNQPEAPRLTLRVVRPSEALERRFQIVSGGRAP